MNKEKELSRIAEEIKRCPLCKRGGKGKAVPGEGSPDAKVVFIGEAPGKEEAGAGRPFVGRSGKYLRARIKETGLDEKEVFITSPVRYLPLHGTPSKENILHGREHLLKQLAVIDPPIVVLLGNTASLAVLGKRGEVMKEHGRVIRKGKTAYLITFHPAAAMRFPGAKRGFTRDLAKLQTLIQEQQ